MSFSLVEYLPSIATFLVGFGAILVWYMLKGKKREYLFCYVLGAILWTIAIAPKYIMDYTITTAINNIAVSCLPILAAVLAMGLYFGLRTGFFESGFTYLILKYAGDQVWGSPNLAKMGFNEAVALGIGFGGFEVLYLLFTNFPFGYMGVWERLFTLFIHVFAIVLVVYAVKMSDRRLLWLSIGYKTATDASIIIAPYFLGRGITEIYVLESYFAILGIIGLIGLCLISKKYGDDTYDHSSKVTGSSINSIVKVTALLATTAVVLTIIAYCSSMSLITSTAPPGISTSAANTAANVTVDRMLESFNTGNYTAFSANFSPAMLSAVNENSFNSARNSILSEYGEYVFRDPVPTWENKGGYNIYTYDSHFERSDLTTKLVMNTTNIWRVEGFFYNK